MTTAWKKTAVYAVLVLLTAWPLVHLGLVARYDLSPWKLAGWGMYSAPRTGAGFQVLARRNPGDEFRPIAVPDAAMPTARRFHVRRRWLGELASPAPLALEILDADPSLGEVAIMIERPFLSTETGYIEARRDVHRYRR